MFSLDELGHNLVIGPPPHLVVFPLFHHHTRLMIRLRHIRSRVPVGCFDQAAIERAFLVGVEVEIKREPGEYELCEEQQIARGTEIHKSYRIVHLRAPEESIEDD